MDAAPSSGFFQNIKTMTGIDISYISTFSILYACNSSFSLILTNLPSPNLACYYLMPFILNLSNLEIILKIYAVYFGDSVPS